MFLIRYLLTFACEFVHSWRTRHKIQAFGYRHSSVIALLSWCHATAHYCALWKHPLRYCADRRRWLEWMQQD